MKKLFVFGALGLALGMSSCKTYCPAYNYVKVDVKPEQNATATAFTTAEKANS
ncbi:hypothetical protein [Pontibacter ruber]|uniref:Lipoprotein n=1 Tax=Pontibacter ruber TaxID=1343895 RepID=A0ABW5D0A4_9BACT|nr:hypothetical protein [Pontibacter ruber]